ncbi:MAG: DUF4331 domain-containing protein [Candidatus Limnocylindrales bacterium]
MSSHREAPGISKDPVADNTDLYAFVSPDRPSTVTLIANYIPLEGPAGGPNFYEFGDDVLYQISVDNDANIDGDVRFSFRFKTTVKNSKTFLYNTGPISSLTSSSWNRAQTYTVTMQREGHTPVVLGKDLACPPVNIGPRSTPDYAALAAAAVHDLSGGAKVFAGQRREGFFVDLGSIFDLGALRPFENLHLIPSAAAVGVDATKALNVHTIALQVPITWLTRGGVTPSGQADPKAVIGVWASASRHRARILEDSKETEVGPWRQVSRLGNPLINEVVIPMAHKDRWNARRPRLDADFQGYVQHPELAGLIPVLYPGVFPHLAAYTKPRADLMAILMTGIPSGVIPGFQNFTGRTVADMLRLNVAIPPSSKPSQFGILGGDLAGYPNGRRVFDDTVAIELRAIGGATIPLVDPSFTADGAAALLTDGTSAGSGRYINHFPYLGVPLDGYHHPGH